VSIPLDLPDKLLQYYRECLYEWSMELKQLSPLTPFEQIVHNMRNKCVGHAVRNALKGVRGLKRTIAPCLTKCMFIYISGAKPDSLRECVESCMGLV